jgi:hypothetical protein
MHDERATRTTMSAAQDTQGIDTATAYSTTTYQCVLPAQA